MKRKQRRKAVRLTVEEQNFFATMQKDVLSKERCRHAAMEWLRIFHGDVYLKVTAESGGDESIALREASRSYAPVMAEYTEKRKAFAGNFYAVAAAEGKMPERDLREIQGGHAE